MEEEETNTEEEKEEKTEEVEETGDLEKLQEKVKTLEEKLEEKEEKLEKLSDKEFNFRRFEKAEEEKRKEMLKGFSKKEKLLVEEMEGLRKRIDESEDQRLLDSKKSALKQLAGTDDDLKKKLEDSVKSSEAYLGKPKNGEELIARYERAYQLLQGEYKRVNPLNQFHPVTGETGPPSRTKYPDTAEGKKKMAEWFPKYARVVDREKKK